MQKNVTPGLDRADSLKPGQGWVAANLQAATDVPLQIKLEAGKKVSDNLALYGDTWVKPTVGSFGADVGARINSNIDLFAGAFASTHGGAGVQAGMEWRF